MKEKFKNVFNKDVWNPIIVGLGVLAIIDWIIYPSLTAPSTIFNIFGLVVAIGTAVFIGVYIKEDFLKDK
jgi:hypothetical protein